MSVQKFPLESIQKIRQYLQSILVLPDSENHPKSVLSFDAIDELPAPDSLDALGDLFNFGSPLTEESHHAPNTKGQWFISATNPGSVLLKLPGLKLKPGFRLVSYLYRTNEDGIGATFALPEDFSTTALLEKALATSGDIQHPPHPEGALADVMEAIEGDRSPSSFIIASLLRRELKELGALGKHCNWSHHRLITAIPPQLTWNWRVEMPKDLSPKARVLPDGKAAVEFFSCRVVPPIAIFQHVDQYIPGQYTGAGVDRALAAGQRT